MNQSVDKYLVGRKVTLLYNRIKITVFDKWHFQIFKYILKTNKSKV